MRPDRARPTARNELLQGLDAAARLVELRAAAIRRGFPALDPAAELDLVAEAIRKLAAHVCDA